MSTSVPVSSGTPTMSSTSQRTHSWDGAKMEGSMCTQYSTDVSEIIIFNSHSVPKYERGPSLDSIHKILFKFGFGDKKFIIKKIDSILMCVNNQHDS